MTPTTVPMAARRRARRGFTLMEVLAAMVLIGIVVPVAMRGVSLSLGAASSARHTAEAAALAEARLNELVTGFLYTSEGSEGDFGPEWPGYGWKLETYPQDYDLTEVVLHVTWTERGRERVLSVSTLVWEGALGGSSGESDSGSGGGTGSGSGGPATGGGGQ